MTERKVIEGLEYWRDSDSKFWTLEDRRANEALPSFQQSPEVICDCGEMTFTLRYGSYEIFAKCVGCGSEESVYSG